MDPCFRIWGHEVRSDSFVGLELGWIQKQRGNRQARGPARRTTLFESEHEKNRKSSPEAVQKQSCTQLHWERQKRRMSRA